MRKVIAVTVATLILASAFMTGADARPQYNSAFKAKYTNVTEAKTKKCGVCHSDPKKKKVRNNYGTALGKALGKDAKTKDKDKINAALDKAAKEKSHVEGKTFGDLLKDGKLPGDK